jgi:UPF0271 protein
VLLGLPGTALEAAAARHSLAYVAEAFADRAYDRTGHLAPRSEPGAVRHEPAAVVEQARSIVLTNRVTAADRTEVSIRAESLCLHGDTPGAAELARSVRSSLMTAGVDIRPFT